jgi:hypothetical protein
MLLRGGVVGTQRVARHLWRMCFGLFIAAGSFFLGPSNRPLRLLSALGLRQHLPPAIELCATLLRLLRPISDTWPQKKSPDNRPGRLHCREPSPKLWTYGT